MEVLVLTNCIRKKKIQIVGQAGQYQQIYIIIQTSTAVFFAFV